MKFINYLLFFSPQISKFNNISIFLPFSFSLFLSFLFSLFSSLLPHVFSSTSRSSQAARQPLGADRVDPPPTAPMAPPAPSRTPLSPSPPRSLPLRWAPMAASHGETQQTSFFFKGWPKQMHMTFLLLSPTSVLSEIKYNPQILWDFVFQINSDFISNSSHNPFGLLLHPYINSGAPSPRIPMPISPKNQTLGTTKLHHIAGAPRAPPPLFRSPPFKLNLVSIVRSQELNHRRKNHVKSRSVASTIYHWSLVIVSRRGCDFSAELEVNPTSPVSSPCRTLTPELGGSEIGGL
jgi:hypothetical protein